MCRSRSKRHHSWLELDSIAVFEPGGQYSPLGAAIAAFQADHVATDDAALLVERCQTEADPNAAHALSSGSCAYIDPERQPVHVVQTLGQPTRKAAA
jgi:hypothetical protein